MSSPRKHHARALRFSFLACCTLNLGHFLQNIIILGPHPRDSDLIGVGEAGAFIQWLPVILMAARVRNNRREEPRIGRRGPQGEGQLESLSQPCKQQQQTGLGSQNGNQIPRLLLASRQSWTIGFNSPNLSFFFCKMRLILSVQDF